ncbi:hypothetical protein [Microcoleus sp. N3A4]|uniref:hypothetical protein n=1 Tax=Microcoleus sp. N3A4 TaxID=3055379 RepID=UPI002FD3D28A
MKDVFLAMNGCDRLPLPILVLMEKPIALPFRLNPERVVLRQHDGGTQRRL